MSYDEKNVIVMVKYEMATLHQQTTEAFAKLHTTLRKEWGLPENSLHVRRNFLCACAIFDRAYRFHESGQIFFQPGVNEHSRLLQQLQLEDQLLTQLEYEIYRKAYTTKEGRDNGAGEHVLTCTGAIRGYTTGIYRHDFGHKEIGQFINASKVRIWQVQGDLTHYDMRYRSYVSAQNQVLCRKIYVLSQKQKTAGQNYFLPLIFIHTLYVDS